MEVETKTDADLIEIPADLLTSGTDADGTPITVATDKAKGGAVETEEKPAKKLVTLAELEAQKAIADEERRLREAAEAAAKTEREGKADAEKRASTSQGHAINAHLHKTYSDYARTHGEVQQIASAIASTEALAASQEKEYVAAAADGDHVRMARVQREIAKLEAERVALETGKRGAEVALNEAKYHYETATAAYGQTADPKKEEATPEVKTVEEKPKTVTPDDWIASCPVAAQPWLREHKEFATDKRANRRLLRFVDKYLDENDDDQKVLNSPEFVKALNEEFFPEEAETMAEEPEVKVVAEKPKAKAVAAAPVSRGGGVFSSTNLNASKVRLPADVVSFCKQAGLNPEMYAAGVVEDIKAGRKPKEWLDPGYDRGIR